MAMETFVPSQHSYREFEYNRYMDGGHRPYPPYIPTSHPRPELVAAMEHAPPPNRQAGEEYDGRMEGNQHKKYEGPEFITYGMLSQHFNESLSSACEKLVTRMMGLLSR